MKLPSFQDATGAFLEKTKDQRGNQQNRGRKPSIQKMILPNLQAIFLATQKHKK